jgi:predicted ATPase
MKLEEFRIQNYKKIRDTGWIKCEDLLVFVGKNEAGKSALLRALSKVKPTDGEKYDGLREFPHGRYTDEFQNQDWPVASAKFVFTDEERAELAGLCSILEKVKMATVTRHYSDQVTVGFEPYPKVPTVTANEWTGVLEIGLKEIEESVAPDGQGDAWTPRKQAIIKYLNGQIPAAKSANRGPEQPKVQEYRQQILSQMNEAWTKPLLQPQLAKVDGVLDKLKVSSELAQARQWVVQHMPYFLYFGRYEILESSIYLPELVQRLQRNDKSPRTRVQQALFKHVGVEIQQLASLGHHQHSQGENPTIRRQIEELSIKANSASLAMTKKFADWWLQRNHRFNYKFNGDYFQIWVADDLDPTDVELEERSQGMRYFFSFYLLFLVEAEEEHRNCILLLDEPGLHLHPTAQEKLIEFLDKLSKTNQIFYSTHSPFLIDGNRLERARAVYETRGGTEVSANVWPNDRDTLFPLQAALGYSVCQTLFVSKKQVLVEGATDYMLLSALNIRLRAENRTALARDIVMLSMGGTTNLAPLASMLAGHNIDLAFLLDTDTAADSALKKLKKAIADVDSRVIKTSDILAGHAAEELEELIPEDYYLDAVKRSCQGAKITFNADEQKIANRVDRLKAYFTRNGLGEFEKWKPILVIVDDIHANNDRLAKELLDTAELIFERINTILSPSSSPPSTATTQIRLAKRSAARRA